MRHLKFILSVVLLLALCLFCFSQEKATRFYYELSYKADATSPKVETVLTILDVAKDKSIYRDNLTVSQDSLIREAEKKANAAGERLDYEKIMVFPKFTYKVVKPYPLTGAIIYTDKILQDPLSYEETPVFNWQFVNETKTIEGYPVQKAIGTFGGRIWTAWFTNDIAIPDGPYKFSGLPGLILQIEDEQKNFSWLLKGIKNLSQYSELSLSDGDGKSKTISKDQFIKTYKNYLKDPLGSVRGQLTKEQLEQKMPDGRTVGEAFRSEEMKIKKLLNAAPPLVELENK